MGKRTPTPRRRQIRRKPLLLRVPLTVTRLLLRRNLTELTNTRPTARQSTRLKARQTLTPALRHTGGQRHSIPVSKPYLTNRRERQERSTLLQQIKRGASLGRLPSRFLIQD